MSEHELPILRAETGSEDGDGEKDAAAGKAVLETTFVHLRAHEDGHEEEEEDLEGADPGDGGGGLGAEEDGFVVGLEDAVGLIKASEM